MNPILTIATRIGLNVVALLGLAISLYLGKTIIIPLVIAALLAVLLFPAARWLHTRLRFSWFFSCILMIAVLILVNIGIFSAFSFVVPRVLQDFPNPNTIEGQERLYTEIRSKVGDIYPEAIADNGPFPRDKANSNLFSYALELLRGNYVTNLLIDLAKTGAAWLWQSVLILFILLFLMLEGEMLGRRIREMFGESRVIQGHVTTALTEIGEAIRAYLVWRTIVNLALAFVLGVVYKLAELKYPWTWALFTAVLCYVPYLGTIIAGIPPVLDAFATVSPLAALGIFVFYTIVVTLEGYIIVPVVMGRSMDLNATTVLLACMFWELVWGIPGLFLAMPLMAGLKAVCMHVEGWRGWGNLMSSADEADDPKMQNRFENIAQKAGANMSATVVMDEPHGRHDNGPQNPNRSTER